MDGIPYISLSV